MVEQDSILQKPHYLIIILFFLLLLHCQSKHFFPIFVCMCVNSFGCSCIKQIVGSKDVLSDRPTLAFPKVCITYCFHQMYGKCSFPRIALPALDNFYLMGKKEKKELFCISLINGEVKVIVIFIGHLQFYHELFLHTLYL